VDTLQTFNCLLHCVKGKPFSELELLSGFVAVAVHDVGHPGVNNAFHVNTQSALALTYSDQSVNEYMHCAQTWRILAKDPDNFMKIFLNDQRNFVKKSILQIILATDMAHHFSNLAGLKGVIERKSRDVTRWDAPLFALEQLAHCADISNPGKVWEVSNQWATRVLAEFFAQGDQERELGLPITTLCDRHTVSRPSSQIGFVNFVVKPLFAAVNEIANMQHILDLMDEYAANNKQILDQEKAAAEEQKKDP
jgi:hypothetical protein